MPENNDSLRAEVRRLRKAVTRKVSRIKHNTGIQMSGSPADPRRKFTVEKDLSESALRDYAHRLAGFLDRSVQFVPDSQRRPMPREQWRTYKALETRWNARVRERMANINDIPLPSGETVRQWQAKMGGDIMPQLLNPSANGPKEIVRESRAVAGASKLQALIESMRARNEPEHFEAANTRDRETFEKMIDVVGDEDLRGSVHSLTDEQFEVLWNWTPFSAAISYQYAMAMTQLEPTGVERRIIEDAIRETNRYVNWAQDLDIEL